MFTSFISAGAMVTGLCITAGAATAYPDVSLNGATGQYTGQELYDAKVFKVTAGGDYSLTRDCGNIYHALQSERGEGYFPVAPDFTLRTPGLQGFRLVISVVSECDSALLINTPAGNWYYDDDDNGNLDARIDLTSPSSGILDIWVGTADGEYCDARLQLETL